MTIHTATTNAGKLHEFTQTARVEGIEILSLPGLGTMPEPVEDAPSFEGNAELKALAYSQHAPGLLVLADDSGLEVSALGGDPGVHSARFADTMGFEAGSELSKDERNNRCLLSMLQQVNMATEGRAGRHARFVCALALARDGRVLLRTEGEVEGEILLAPQGQNGFGYDPLFFVPRLGRSLAELGPEEKWAISHRGKAFLALLAHVHETGLQ